LVLPQADGDRMSTWRRWRNPLHWNWELIGCAALYAFHTVLTPTREGEPT
jgi:hypothetical protein